ncbi:hypothetical protein [Achromobacter insuavis]|uniref:hypothetical protein n=1 Tax=Achromobacter insuavis TaxID=1287735 RepID=UPI0012F48DCE|nr:hypothetical protein [Achromobacter insuavis]
MQIVHRKYHRVNYLKKDGYRIRVTEHKEQSASNGSAIIATIGALRGLNAVFPLRRWTLRDGANVASRDRAGVDDKYGHHGPDALQTSQLMCAPQISGLEN